MYYRFGIDLNVIDELTYEKTDEKNKIYAVIIDGEEATLKYVVQEEEQIVLHSSNPTYSPRIFFGEGRNEIIIVGKMVKLQRDIGGYYANLLCWFSTRQKNN